ncbi:hypothetical protein B0H14DRAFT_2637750 [Mycena olivaceomarginata]|nr:hypothetical protein B0H14DRAFT_2637750 [Mycena olivaceomarginata]
MSGCSTHSTPQAGARPQRTETSTPWGQASIIPECDGGVGGVECGVQSQAFRTCLAAQPMALHKLAQDHREKRHPNHEGKAVYYPENVVEVLETGTWLLWNKSMITPFGFHNIFSLILSDFGSLAGFGSLEGSASLALVSSLRLILGPLGLPPRTFWIELSSCPPNESRARQLILSQELSTASP